MSTSSLWDDPEVVAAATSSGYMKFDAVGDAVVGTIATLGKHIWADGSVAIQVTFLEDDVPTLTASQVMLKSALFQLKPNAGDRLSVVLREVEQLGTKTLKKFRVTVTRPGGQVDEVDQSDAPAF